MFTGRTLAILAVLSTSLPGIPPVHGQTLLWSARYDSGGEDGLGAGKPFRVDGSGAVTLAGRAGSDYFLVRYWPNGTFDTARVQTPTPTFGGASVAVDSEGRALWAGASSVSMLSVNLLLRLAFQGDPEVMSSFTLTDPAFQSAYGFSVATAADGGTFLGYLVTSRFGGRAEFLQKVGAGGWSAAVAQVLGSGVVVHRHVVPDAWGGALVTTGSGPLNQQLQRLDPHGLLVWSRSLDAGPGLPNLIAMDGDGQAIVSGRSLAGDFETVKIDAAGGDLWHRTFNGAGKGEDIPAALTRDVGGSTYVAGSSMGTLANTDYATAKYDYSGNLLWSRTYDGGGQDAPAGVAVDGAGSAWVTGTSGNDVVTLKYDAGGAQVFSHRFVSPGPATVAGVDVDGWGNATVAFSAAGDVFVLRYGQAPVNTGPLVLNSVDPCRAFDSRDPTLGGPNPLAGPSDRVVALAGVCGVPDSAKAVSLNVTAVGATQPGSLALFPAGQTLSATSSLNYSAGQIRANNATVGLGTNASLGIRISQGGGTVHVLIDVVGYWE